MFIEDKRELFLPFDLAMTLKVKRFISKKGLS